MHATSRLRSAASAALKTLEERNGSDHPPKKDVISFHSLLAGPPSKIMPAAFVPQAVSAPLVPHDFAEMAAGLGNVQNDTTALARPEDESDEESDEDMPITLRSSGIFPSRGEG